MEPIAEVSATADPERPANKIDDIISIIDTSKPFQDPSKNKFLMRKAS